MRSDFATFSALYNERREFMRRVLVEMGGWAMMALAASGICYVGGYFPCCFYLCVGGLFGLLLAMVLAFGVFLTLNREGGAA